MQGDVDMKSYPFTPDMKKLPVEQLFDCMAAKLVEFAHECGQDPTAKVSIDWGRLSWSSVYKCVNAQPDTCFGWQMFT